MSVRSLSRSFAGGEVTPEFFGRVDDAKNQTGLAKCRNFRILPHGPAQNRGGTQFVKSTKYADKLTRVIEFSYSDEQTLIIETGDQYMRFHTFGATLLAGTPAAWSAVTAYTPGDLVLSGGVNYYCILAHTNQVPPNATYWYAMPADGTFEIPTPYLEDDVFDIHYVQSKDVITLAHTGYEPRELRRLGATQWVMAPINFASLMTAPVATSATATGAGAITYTYLVTAVDNTGKEESLQSNTVSCVNNLVTAGNFNTIAFNASAGAARYNVYKQDNGLFGYIGQTDALTFKDQNIVADISRTPPIASTPFTGAGNYPGAVSYYEQRRDFGGTINLPDNIWMTRAGTEKNLSYSIPTKDADAISFKIASLKASTVRHLVPSLELLVLTSAAVWKVTSVNSDSITPTSIAVRPQAYVGASNVQPLVVNVNVVYAAARGGHIHAISYSAVNTAYSSGDLCLRAPHLFDNYEIIDMTQTKAPYPMVFAVSSSGIILGLTYVPDQDIYPWYWYDSYTNGGDTTQQVEMSKFKSVAAVAEGREDVLYAVVQRIINGATVQYIERFVPRAFTALPQAYFVDAGVSYDVPQAITNITRANPGHITVPGHDFANGEDVDITDVVGMTDINLQRVYVANRDAAGFDIVDEYGANIDTTNYKIYKRGGNARRVLSVVSSGLSHLEGEAVNILGNGAVQPKQIVVGGAVTLDQPASVIQIGLPIQADLQTLPVAYEKVGAFGQGMVKNVNAIWMRVFESSGIFAGPNFDNLTEKKQRTNEPYGTPPALKSAELSLVLQPSWGDSASVCIRQDDPLPLTLTSMTIEAEIGS